MQKHGMSHTSLYKRWHDMKMRCDNKNNCNYKYYGEKGITYCKEWSEFKPFYEWAISNGYRSELSLDRIDVKGNYCPENCRWVTHGIQMANRNNTGKCEYIGVWKHSNGTRYCTFIEKNKKRIFSYSSQSKNDCAKARNDYILSNNLDYPLNDVKPEYEEICHRKYETYCIAISKATGKEIKTNSIAEMASKIGMTRQFISSCLAKKRNCKNYDFIYQKVGVR